MSIDWLSSDTQWGAHSKKLSDLLARDGTLAVAGCHDGISALLAKQAGFEALYLSGAALSASMALPDLGLMTMEEFVRAARTVVRATDLPLVVDCDTGFGEALNVMRAVKEMEAVGVACMQIEDQDSPKKCGHLNDKRLIGADDMCRKIAAAKRASGSMLICARTDAVMISIEEAITRARRYVEAGADVIFVEAMTSSDQIGAVRAAINVPLLGNMTEFGRTPQIPLAQWSAHGVDMVIYPVSALRIAARAMESFYAGLMDEGTAQSFLPSMMTRAQLYEAIDYFGYEELDASVARTVLPD
jgi:methylisocitrate lyase